MRWSDIEHAQPRLAGLARQRLIGPGVVLVATTRRDGTPRLSPVEPYVLDGDLWLSMMWQSAKARDLRDPRIPEHSAIASRDGAEGELKIRGAARAELNQPIQRRYSQAVAADLGWNCPRPPGQASTLERIAIPELGAERTAVALERAGGGLIGSRGPPDVQVRAQEGFSAPFDGASRRAVRGLREALAKPGRIRESSVSHRLAEA
jgi:hypothetical protein